MKDSNFFKPQKLVKYSLLFYFLIPYLIFLKYFTLRFNVDFKEFAWAFQNAIVQSASAALIVTLLSVPLSLGLTQIKEKYSNWINQLLLIPQILPSIFSILIAFQILQPFPMGTIGIIFIFSLVHLGFAIVLLSTSTKEKLNSYSVVSEVYGISRRNFFIKVYFPIMFSDLLTNLLMIFIFCFSSFSIPLIAGGGRGTNLEVLIYEKIFIGQDWSTAWSLNLIQSLFIFSISYFVLKNKEHEKAKFTLGRYLRSKIGLMLLLVYLAIYLGGYFYGVVNSFKAIDLFLSFKNEIIESTLNSLKFLILFLSVSSILFIFWIYDFVYSNRQNISKNLISPSTILVGFSFYLFFPTTKDWDFIKVSLAMSIIFFPVLLKSFLEKPIEALKNQVIISRLYNISFFDIFFKIILPQLKKPMFIWFSFLVVWCLSDFAIQKTLGTQSQTVGLMAASFLNSYRLSLAYLTSVYIILLWLFFLMTTFILIEVGHVYNKKFKS